MTPDVDPNQQPSGPPPGVTFGAPPPPAPAAQGAPPPGVTFGAPPPAPDPLAANPKNEGVYKMDGPGGPSSIPYSNVAQAFQKGYSISDQAEQARYTKDRSADPHTSMLKDVSHLLVEQPAKNLAEMGKGALKSAAQVPMTIGGWLDSMETKLNHMDEKISGQSNSTPADLVSGHDPNEFKGTKEHIKNFLEQHAPGITNAPVGQAQERGAMIENAAEFATGDKVLGKLTEALPWLVQGGNYADKLKIVQPLLKVAAEHPHIAKTLLSGLTNATVGTGQALAHGEELPDALKTGAVAGATGAVLEGAGEGFEALREGAAAKAATTAAHEAAPAVLGERTAAMNAERQATAQGQVKDVARQGTEGALDRFNEATAPPLTKTGEPAYPPTVEQVDAAAHAAQVNSFGEAADKLRSVADPVYKTIDKSTGGEFAKLQKTRSKAYATGDFDKAGEAEDAIDELLKKKPEDVSPADYAAAKSAWSDSKVLDKLHAATEGAFNGISEEQAAQPGTGARLLKGGDSQGGSLQKRIGALMRKPADAANVERVIGKEGVTNLYRASHLVSTPELKAQTQALAEAVAAEFPAPAESHPVVQALKDSAIGATVGAVANHLGGGHLPASITAPAGAVMANGARFVLRKMVTSPRIGQMMDFAIRNNVTPKVAASLIAAEIQKEHKAEKTGQEEDK